jgi:predicted ATP-grasp superfamily ATP-dependent carboligase
LGYQGLLDLDIRLDPHHGEDNLLAGNMRLGRSSGSFRHAASAGVALAAYLDLTSRKTRKVHVEAR